MRSRFERHEGWSEPETRKRDRHLRLPSVIACCLGALCLMVLVPPPAGAQSRGHLTARHYGRLTPAEVGRPGTLQLQQRGVLFRRPEFTLRLPRLVDPTLTFPGAGRLRRFPTPFGPGRLLRNPAPPTLAEPALRFRGVPVAPSTPPSLAQPQDGSQSR
jgi:hypothetical protein